MLWVLKIEQPKHMLKIMGKKISKILHLNLCWEGKQLK